MKESSKDKDMNEENNETRNLQNKEHPDWLNDWVVEWSHDRYLDAQATEWPNKSDHKTDK